LSRIKRTESFRAGTSVTGAGSASDVRDLDTMRDGASDQNGSRPAGTGAGAIVGAIVGAAVVAVVGTTVVVVG
jgi:hypothetical protein